MDDAGCTASLSKSQPMAVAAKNSPFYKSCIELVRKVNQKNVLKTLAKLQKPEIVKDKKKESSEDSKDLGKK